MPSKFSRYWSGIDQTPNSLSTLKPHQVADLKEMIRAAFHAGIHVKHKDRAELLDRIAALETRTCTWTKSIYGVYGEYDNWATQCGEDYAITEEWHKHPSKFCPNCGGKTVEVVPPKEELDDD